MSRSEPIDVWHKADRIIEDVNQFARLWEMAHGYAFQDRRDAKQAERVPTKVKRKVAPGESDATGDIAVTQGDARRIVREAGEQLMEVGKAVGKALRVVDKAFKGIPDEYEPFRDVGKIQSVDQKEAEKVAHAQGMQARERRELKARLDRYKAEVRRMETKLGRMTG